MHRHDSAFSDAVSSLSALESRAEGDTAIHRLHPLVKMTVTVVYVAVVISFGRYNIRGLMPYFFYPAILAPLSETPFRLLARRLLPALPFPLLGGVGNMFFDKVPMMFIGGVTVTGGVLSFASIMIKTVLSVSAILLLVSTTGMADLSKQLAAMKVPDIFVLQLVMTYRYLLVLVDETRDMYAAYILRSPGARGIRMRDMGTFVGALLLRSIGRAERVYDAMKCRGFRGTYPAPPRGRVGARDAIGLTVICCVIVLPRCLY